ncbi:hypothetical protein Plhal710r2_c028g0105961 [Plasmopara halstedii]
MRSHPWSVPDPRVGYGLCSADPTSEANDAVGCLDNWSPGHNTSWVCPTKSFPSSLPDRAQLRAQREGLPVHAMRTIPVVFTLVNPPQMMKFSLSDGCSSTKNFPRCPT